MPVSNSALRGLLGITHPILQSGMGGVAGPELVAAVSNAGGLGILAALNLRPEALRSGIEKVRELTDRPFGVNIWLHADVRTPVDVGRLDDDLVRGMQSVLNDYRPRHDLPPKLDRPPAPTDLVGPAIEVMLEERIPVFSAGLGIPETELTQRLHEHGTKVIAMVTSVADALAAAAQGTDVVVVQGSEAGGHRSVGAKLPQQQAVGGGLFTLLPEVIRRLAAAGTPVPVVAAGGIVDGRGLAAALVLGAQGALLGTRFVATQESQANDVWKQKLIGDHGETVVSDAFTGQWARMLRTEFTDRWAESGRQA
ncbi:MAG: nitronate monooxygenase, partial [Actinomycetota bacterium]|nr:nitronate monooxygenase [Actinomycetota bacterium]